MKISDYIVSFLAEKGITDVFGYPGGMVTHLMDSFGKQDKIKAHVTYHEQGAAFAACGYAQTSLLPGVAYATSGPGATNLITGIANAYFDSIPCVFITGQVNTYESKGGYKVRQKGFQETDIISIVKSITKYAVQVVNPEDIQFELEKAYHLSLSGRPGPVLLDIPMNISRSEVNLNQIKHFIVETKKEEQCDLSTVVTELKSSKRPCILVGAGVKSSGMVDEFRKLSKKLSIPIVSSILAVDVLPHSDPNYYGFIGAYGSREANFIAAKCDLLISIGSRLDCRQTGSKKENFAPNAKIIRFDIDEDEMSNKIKNDEIQIVSDIKNSISELYTIIDDDLNDKYSDWKNICLQIREKLSNLEIEDPNKIINAFSKLIPDNLVVTTDVGQNQMWVAQSFEVKNGQKILFSGGHGAMGYSLPAAIGAYYASRNKVIAFTGDGGLQMNIQELQFLAREKLPIKIVVLNNKSLGMIRHFQEMYFDSCFVQTIDQGGYSTPDLKKIAAAYNLDYFLINGEEDCSTECVKSEKPAIIEIAMNKPTYVFPKLSINMPSQDQDPLIDRELYNYLMNL